MPNGQHHNPDDIFTELIDDLRTAFNNATNNVDKGAIRDAAEVIDSMQMTTKGRRECKVGSTIP